MIASTWLDLVVGLDIHFEMVPMPAPVPTPFPHPFVGMVFDPAGLAMGLAISNTIGMIGGGSFKGPVLIWGMPANTTGTEAKNSFVLPHFVIPPGTMWTPMPKAPKPPFKGKTRPPDLPVAPAGDAVMITGSKTVTTMGSNQCRLGDLAMSCAEPVRLPSSAVIAIPKGPLVLVGGPPAVDWVAAAMAFIKTKTIANELHGLVGRIKNARLRNFCHWAVCTLTGHPVDVATGRVMTRATDWELPGPIPLTFERHYSSAWSNRDSALGWGWSHSLDQAVWVERGCVVYRAGDGREVEFDTFALPDHAMRPGDSVWDPFNRLTLRNTAPFAWEVETPEGLTHRFAPVQGGDARVARLTRINDRAGNEVLLTYDPRGCLDYVRDSGGRVVRFEHDARGRLARVSLPHPSVEAWVTHTRYEYTEGGELAAATDPLGHATRFEYAGEHLLVRETDRCGMSFYFGYDGAGADARCARTWGDGGVYDHVLFYDPKARRTAVTDSLGHTTLYEFNEINLVVKRTDPLGNVWVTEYDANGWKAAEVDPLGGATRWAYDDRGATVALERPDGATWRFDRNASGALVRMLDPCENVWRWERDDADRVLRQVGPDGQHVHYRYGPHGPVEITSNGAVLALERDARGGVVGLHPRGGPPVRFTLDRLGRVAASVERGGARTERAYDPAGRLVRVTIEGGDERSLAYDARGRVTSRTANGEAEEFTWWGDDRLASRGRGGAVARNEYDTEGRLVAFVNERGGRFELTRDARGRVVREVDFSGRARSFELDARGEVAGVVEGGRRTAVARDPTGRVLQVAGPGGSVERYAYRKDGFLAEAINDAAAVRFERDAYGRVLRETSGDQRVSTAYDAWGMPWEVETSLGLRSRVTRDGTGRAVAAAFACASDEWEVAFERAPDGAELARRFTGATELRWAWGDGAAPVAQEVAVRGQVRRSRRYAWSSGWLREVVDTAEGRTVRTRDARGRLVREDRDVEAPDWTARDEVGNVFRSPTCDDVAYGPSGEPLAVAGERWRWEAGALRERVLPDGRRWRYDYDDAGMLREAVDPDGRRTRFGYDALGRRVWKEHEGEVTRWVWSGDAVLHEVRGDGVTSWVMTPDGREVMARHDEGAWAAAVPDLSGTLLALYDRAGREAWGGSYDARGALTAERGRAGRQPWRRRGQYHDAETGLAYNRSRYYDPRVGTFLRADPIGPVGGLNLCAYVDDPALQSDPSGLSPDWGVDPSMVPGDVTSGVATTGPGGTTYVTNPSRMTPGDLNVTPGGRVRNGTQLLNGQYMYTVTPTGELALGTRGGAHMPHPTLVGGLEPRVQAAGIVEFRGGRVVSIDNGSGHFKPGVESVDAAHSAFRDAFPEKAFDPSFTPRDHEGNPIKCG